MDYYNKVHRCDVSNNRNVCLTVLETEKPKIKVAADSIQICRYPSFILFSHGGDCEPSFSSYKDIICIMRVPSSWFYLKLPPKSPPLNTIPLGVKVPIYRFEQERGHEHVGQSIFKLQAENAVCQTKKEKNLLFVFDIYYKEVAYCKYQIYNCKYQTCLRMNGKQISNLLI